MSELIVPDSIKDLYTEEKINLAKEFLSNLKGKTHLEIREISHISQKISENNAIL